MEPILVKPGVSIPPAAMSVHFARSSGPGGQNVNKVASKVYLHVDLALIEGLPEPARARLTRAIQKRRDSRGRLLVVSQRSRDQHRNLEDARARVLALVEKSLAAPSERRPTGPTTSSRERRLQEKKRAGVVKRLRRRAGRDLLD